MTKTEKLITVPDPVSALSAGVTMFMTSRTARRRFAVNSLTLAVVYAAGFMTAALTACTKREDAIVEPAAIVEAIPTPEADDAALWLENARESVLDAQAESVARVLYGMRKNSEDDLRRVVWCICNRVDSPLYPDTVEDVCEQPSQWVGYYDSNPVTDRLKTIAKDELRAWRDGTYRLLNADALWFDWSSNGIWFKDEF